MAIKLDAKDRRLLALLDENSRFSNSQLAKKIGLSKPAVEYRIKRLETNKIIFQYYAIIDFTKLGYSPYKMYLKFQDITLEEEKSIITYWKNDSNSVWVAQIRGEWDVAVTILAKSNYEFGTILSHFMNKYSRYVLEKDVLLIQYSPIYTGKNDMIRNEFLYGPPSKIYPLDKIDIKLLKTLSSNTRQSIVELIGKTGLTRDIITYRLKRLCKDRIIVNYRCYPNMKNLGTILYKIILRTKNLDEKREMQLRTFVAQQNKSSQFLKLIGSWDIEIEYETADEDELYDILGDIRKKFSDIIRDFDIIRITETYKYTFYPF